MREGGSHFAYRVNCSNNLRQIGLAIRTYADENMQQFPTELGALILLQAADAQRG